jgi:hypothetical protein
LQSHEDGEHTQAYGQGTALRFFPTILHCLSPVFIEFSNDRCAGASCRPEAA